MNENLSELSDVQLLKKIKKSGFAKNLLGGMIITMVVFGIINRYVGGSLMSTTIPMAFLPIMIVASKKHKRYKKEAQNRKILS